VLVLPEKAKARTRRMKNHPSDLRSHGSLVKFPVTGNGENVALIFKKRKKEDPGTIGQSISHQCLARPWSRSSQKLH